MSWRQDLAREPWRHDFFWALDRHEAANADKPRIGDTSVRREEYLDLGQQPFLDFGPANIASYKAASAEEKARMRVKFLGMLGPMGPLPTNTTEEALAWFSRRDDAFVRFLDIFNNRFLQLFYRAHSDARPASHALRPDDDRFRDYVGAFMGIGAAGWRNLDSMPDAQKLSFAGLLGSRTVSASRIENLVAGIFGTRAEVEQFMGTYLPLSRAEQTRLGMANAGLGFGAMVGERVLSVDNKFRVRIYPGTLPNYEKFLPKGKWCQRLVDALSNAVGMEYEWDIELVLPDHEPRPAQLGTYGQLGWTSWVREQGKSVKGLEVRTRFSPMSEDAVTMQH